MRKSGLEALRGATMYKSIRGVISCGSIVFSAESAPKEAPSAYVDAFVSQLFLCSSISRLDDSLI